MKTKLSLSLFLAMTAMSLSISCNKENENENEKKLSSSGQKESHNQGKNCMNCHKPGGEGEGWFNVAGTVYDSLKANAYPHGNIKLYTGPGGTGTLKYTLQVDGLGNFYTTENIEFGSGLYPAVEGIHQVKYMPSAVLNSQCSSCHGVNTDKIWAN